MRWVEIKQVVLRFVINEFLSFIMNWDLHVSLGAKQCANHSLGKTYRFFISIEQNDLMAVFEFDGVDECVHKSTPKIKLIQS